MSKNHDVLLKLVKNNRLRITSIIGTPRSGSTMAAKALAQVCDISLDGLFRSVVSENDPKGARMGISDLQIYDIYCGAILKIVREKLNGKEPVHAVIKLTSGNMSASLFRLWSELPSAFLLTFRDPCSQCISLARAYYGRFIAKTIEPPGIVKFIEENLKNIENNPYPTFNGTLTDFNMKRWELTLDEVNVAKETFSQGRNVRVVFLESTLMRFDPQQAWSSVFECLNIGTENVRRLLYETWMKGFANEKKEITAFKARVYKSTGIQPLGIWERINLSKVPFKSRSHICDLLPFYRELLIAPENAYAPSPDESQRQFCYGSHLTLYNVNPLVAKMVSELRQPQHAISVAPALARQQCG